MISAGTTVVGVIGHPVGHSLSPRLHNAAFRALGLDWVSLGFDVPPGRAAGALEGLVALRLAGFSVTMPHKQEVARLVDDLDPVAGRLEAVNCCIRYEDRVRGVNTDGAGFLESLARGAGIDVRGRSCMVLGAGGAAAAVVLALAQAGAAQVRVVARRPEQAAGVAGLAGPVGSASSPADADAAADAAGVDVVVNATPVGMAGTVGEDAEPLVAASALGAGQVAVDLVYHPRQTRWLDEAAANGATTLGGLGMLVHQAAHQITLWTGEEAPVEAMWEAAVQPLS